tara:strand:+ start:340 stop:1098 length:759 start_codon:yes stop_codon:yes gene_type:complete
MAPLGLGAGFYRLGPTLDDQSGVKICRPDLYLAAGEYDGAELKHWYKYNTRIGTNETGVTVWEDLVSSNNLTPADTGDANEQPELSGDGGLRFQQNTDSLVFGSALSLGNFSIYFVHKFRLGETVSNEVMFEGASDSIKFSSANEARIKVNTRHDFDIPSANQIDENKTYVFGVERASDGSIAMYKDNIALGDKDGDSLAEAISTTFDITQIGDPNGDSIWYEVVIFDNALTTEQRECLYSYLLSVKGAVPV